MDEINHGKSVSSAYFSPVTGNYILSTAMDDKIRYLAIFKIFVCNSFFFLLDEFYHFLRLLLILPYSFQYRLYVQGIGESTYLIGPSEILLSLCMSSFVCNIQKFKTFYLIQGVHDRIMVGFTTTCAISAFHH